MKKRYFLLTTILTLLLFLAFSIKTKPIGSSYAMEVPKVKLFLPNLEGLKQGLDELISWALNKYDQNVRARLAEDNPQVLSQKDSAPNSSNKEAFKVESEDQLISTLIEGLNHLSPERTVNIRGQLPYKPNQVIRKIEAQTDGSYISAVFRTLEVKYETISILNKKTLQTKVTLNAIYHHSKEQESLIDQWVDLKILEWGLSDMSDYEKIRTIHDKIIASASYMDTVNPNEGKYSNSVTTYAGISVHSPYSIIANGKGVCQSYASLFQKFCDRLSIPSKYIIGLASSDGAVSDHAWNKVQIDGAWYNIDLTWDDPVVEFNDVRIDRSFSGFESKKYFLKSDDFFAKDHQAKNGLEYLAPKDYQ